MNRIERSVEGERVVANDAVMFDDSILLPTKYNKSIDGKNV